VFPQRRRNLPPTVVSACQPEISFRTLLQIGFMFLESPLIWIPSIKQTCGSNLGAGASRPSRSLYRFPETTHGGPCLRDSIVGHHQADYHRGFTTRTRAFSALGPIEGEVMIVVVREGIDDCSKAHPMLTPSRTCLRMVQRSVFFSSLTGFPLDWSPPAHTLPSPNAPSCQLGHDLP